MPDVTTHTVPAAAPHALVRFARPILVVAERVSAFFAGRRAVAELAGLDAAMLRDIGLTESDIARAIETPLGEDPTEALARTVRERRLARAAQLRDARLQL